MSGCDQSEVRIIATALHGNEGPDKIPSTSGSTEAAPARLRSGERHCGFRLSLINGQPGQDSGPRKNR